VPQRRPRTVPDPTDALLQQIDQAIGPDPIDALLADMDKAIGTDTRASMQDRDRSDGLSSGGEIPVTPKRGPSYASMADQLKAPAPVDVPSDILPSSQIFRPNMRPARGESFEEPAVIAARNAPRPVVPSSGPVASPFEQSATALATPTGPSLKEIAEGKSSGQPAATRLGSAKTGGMATAPLPVPNVMDALPTAAGAFRALPTAIGETVFGQSLPGHERETGGMLDRLKAHAQMVLGGRGGEVQPIGLIKAATNPQDSVQHTTDAERMAMGTFGSDVIPEDRVLGRGEQITLETARRGMDMVAQLLTDPTAIAAMGIRGVAGELMGAAFGVHGLQTAATVATDPNATPEDVAEAMVNAGVLLLPAGVRMVRRGARAGIDVLHEKAGIAREKRAAAEANTILDVTSGKARRVPRGDIDDAVVTPPRPQIAAEGEMGRAPSPEAVVAAIDDAIGPSEPRSVQGPTTPTPVAVRPGVSASVGPVASSPVPSPDASAVAPTAPAPEFTPVGAEPPIVPRVASPAPQAADDVISRVQDKLAHGERLGTVEARQAFDERQRVESVRKSDEVVAQIDKAIGPAPEASQPATEAPAVAEPEDLRTSTRRTFSKGYDKPNLHERRELGVMLKEMENIEYTSRSLVKFDNARPDEWLAGSAGAEVFSDIKGSNREAVSNAIRRVLAGKKATAIGERAIDIARKRLDESGYVSPRVLPVDAGNEPGLTYVESTPDMTAAEAAVERPFREAVENRTDKMVRAYRKRFPEVISADDAKEMSPEYAKSKETKAKFNRAVHRTSSALADARYRTELKEPPANGKDPQVVFLAGATGVGKTTVRRNAGFAPVLAQAQIVVDGPLSQFGTSERRIQAALDAGKAVSILYVHQDPKTAWDGVLERGAGEGRQPSEDYHVKSHVGSLETIDKLAARFADDPRVTIEYAHNPRGGDPVVVQRSDLPQAYNEEDVRASLAAAGPQAENAAGAEVQQAPTGRGEQHGPARVDDAAGRPAEEVAPAQSSSDDIVQQIDSAIGPAESSSQRHVERRSDDLIPFEGLARTKIINGLDKIESAAERAVLRGQAPASLADEVSDLVERIDQEIGDRTHITAGEIQRWEQEIADKLRDVRGAKPVAAPPVTPARPERSLQEESEDRARANASKVAADPDAASDNELDRAAGYLSRRRESRRHKLEREGGDVKTDAVLTGIIAEQEWYERILRERRVASEKPKQPEPPREFSSTQIDLPPAAATAIRELAAEIPDADLADDGREDAPHVTVKYGLHTSDVEDVRRALAGERPIFVTLGKTSIFPSTEGADYDVVKVDVDSPDLHRLNAKIAAALEHTDTHPTYKPHATIAYVKAGEGKKYVGRTDLDGQYFRLDAITFSGKDGQVISIPLAGKSAVPVTPKVDVLDTGEEQPRLEGAEGARKVGKADVTFKAPQQASGDDFNLSGEETPAAKAAREAAVRGPSMFEDEQPAQSAKPSIPVTPRPMSPHIEVKEQPADQRGPYFTITVRNGGSIQMTAMERDPAVVARIRQVATTDPDQAAVEVNRILSAKPAPPVTPKKEAGPAVVKTYEADKHARPYEVLEADYLAHKRAGQIRNYERGIADEEAALAKLGPKATTSRQKHEVTIAGWKLRLQELKTGTRDDARWREEYAATVKKAISTGKAVPAAVITQRPEFTKAVDARARYDKGRHTSFANKSVAVDSGTVAEYGVKVKRQDGTAITDEQVRHITTGIREIEKAIGPIGNILRALDPTVAHTNGKFPFMRGDAGGLYSPDERTITVGISDLRGRPIRALAHEVGHLLDISAGVAMGVSTRVHGASRSYDSHSLAEVDSAAANVIREATRRINDTREVQRLVKAELGKQETADDKADVQRAKVQLGPYWRSPREVFARLFEQYVADELGARSEAADAPTVYGRQPGWWTVEAFAEMKPKVKAAIDERLGILRERHGLDGESAEPKRSSTSGGGTRSMAGPAKPLPSQPKGQIPVTERMRPSAIIEKLRKGLGDIPVNVGRYKQRALGIYKPGPQAVRLQVANDLQTLTHELGHHLDEAVLQISRKDPKWRDELQAMGQPTSRPSYSVKQQRQEGAAEFLRQYLIEPHKAAADAPAYFAEFERKLAEHPELKKVLLEAREDLAGLIAQDPATRGKLRIDFTGEDSSGIYQRLKNDPKGELRNLATLWIDDLQALKVAVDEMRDARPIDARENAYVLARNARGTGGMAEGMLSHGVRGRNGRFLSTSLGDAITPVKAHLEEFASYLVARRVLEVQALKRKETGMSAEEARAIVKEVEAGPRAAEMAKAADNVYAYQQALLTYAKEYHAISKEQYQTLLKEAHYVPLQRVMDAVGGAMQGSGAKKLANRSSPIKRMKGSGRDIVNPLEAIIRNTFAIVDMVEKNRAMQALVRQADKSAGSAKWLEAVPAPQIATQFNLSQIEKNVRAELDAAGVDLPDNLDLDALVTVFTPSQMAMPGQNLVTVIRDGKRQFYEVHDQALYDAITAIGSKASSTLIEWASKPAALIRAGATLTPGFIARNPTRDTLVAFMQSRYGFIPVYDTIRGFLSLALGEPEAKLFLTSGVQQSSLVGADRDRLRKKIDALSVQSRATFLRSMVLHPVDLLRAISESMEVATRLGEFRLAINAGGKERRAGALGVMDRLTTKNTPTVDDETLTRATLAARDVTTDFSRGGSFAKEVSRVKAFFNARVQGYVRMVETAQRDPVGTTLNVTLLALLSYALWWTNHDDDEYDEIPDWEKNAFWHIPTPAGFVKVAKPFEWAYLANLTEAALAHVKGKNPDALNRIKPGGDPKALAFGLMPSALSPVLEAAFNYDTFRGGPIVKPWDTGLEPELQRSEWTTDTGVQIGKLLNVSPAKVDHIIFGYGAGFARGIVEHGTDPALALGGLITPKKAEAPEKKWQRVPVVGTFLREGTFDSSSQSLKDFYVEYERVQGGERSAKRFADTNPKDALAFVKEKSDERWVKRRQEIKAAKSALEDLGDEVNAIYAAPPSKATPEQKRAALDKVYERMVGIARQALGKPPLRPKGTIPVTPRAAAAK
jgi:2'-5' RNA ligase/flagellar biosynthesis GTPase FlhF